jgi:exonuclease III
LKIIIEAIKHKNQQEAETERLKYSFGILNAGVFDNARKTSGYKKEYTFYTDYQQQGYREISKFDKF